MNEEQLFKCRIEELPFLGKLAFEFFNRDKTDFVGFSPDYDDPFPSNFMAQNKAVDELVAPVKLTAEMKKITQRLVDHYNHARNLVNKCQRYAEKANDAGIDLTMNPSDFGFKAVRLDIKNRNDEGVVKNLKILQSNMKDNLSALAPKGYNENVQNELSGLISGFSEDSIAQSLKKKEREKLVQNNMDKLNKYWLMVNEVLKDGKSIYKGKDQKKVNDYTYSELIKNVRLTRKKEDPETPDAPEV